MNQASAQNKYCTQLTYFPVQTKLEPGNAGKSTEEKVQKQQVIEVENVLVALNTVSLVRLISSSFSSSCMLQVAYINRTALWPNRKLMIHWICANLSVSDSRSPGCCMDKHGYGSVLIHNL